MTSVIIVVWNNLKFTKECIEFLTKNTDLPYELIVVDNKSSDGTVKWLESLPSKDSKRINLKIIKNQENKGFSKAVNQGLAVSEGEYIFLLNNDLLVSQNWLSTLIGHIETLPNAIAVGAMGRAIGNKQDYAGIYGELPYSNLEDKKLFIDFARKINTENKGNFTESKSLSGSCMLIKADIFKELGGLDEGCRMGADDADISIQLRLKGYRLYVAEDVFVHHHDHVSFKLLDEKTQKQAYKESWDYFNHKWHYLGVYFDVLLDNEEKWNYDGLFKNRRGYASREPFSGEIKDEVKSKIKLDLGAGENPAGGVGDKEWIHCDAHQFPCIEEICDLRKLPFDDNYADEIYSSNVIEHFTLEEVPKVFEEWLRVLKPGGKMTIITPDVEHTCKEYVDGKISAGVVSMNFLGKGGFLENTHKSLWDRASLIWVMQGQGITNIYQDFDFPDWQLKLIAEKDI